MVTLTEDKNNIHRKETEDEEEFEDLEPTAGLTSAASCICLSLFGENFHPVYTHQCFDGEHIRGYAPVQEAADKAAEIAALLRKELSSDDDPVKNKVKFNDDENSDGDDDDDEKEPLPHSSFRHQCNASHCLSVDVALSPSCRYCAVSVHIERKGERRIKRKRKASVNVSYVDDDDEIDYNDDTSDASGNLEEEEEGDGIGKRKRQGESETNDNSRKSKRRNTARNLEVNDDDDSISLGSEDTDCDDLSEDENASYEDADDEDFCEEDKSVTPKQGKTRRQSMELEDIMTRLSRGLPAIQSYKESIKGSKQDSREAKTDKYLTDPKQKMSKEDVENDFLDSTFGVELCQYSRISRSNKPPAEDEEHFVLCYADGKDPMVVEYHKQVQKLARWYIETAEDVDLTSDEGGGFWKVLYLFQKHSKGTGRKKSTQYSFVGFVTLFFFFAPFKKPKPGLIVRICQIIILPPYQRSGHGKKLLRTIYDMAQNKYASVIEKSSDHNVQGEIVEINVESPAPAFVALRNRLDYEILKENVMSMDDKKQVDELWLPQKYFTDGNFDTLLDSDAVQAASYAKVTPSQIQIAYELMKLESLQSQIQNKPSSNKEQFTEEITKKFRLMVKKRLNITNKEDLSRFPTKAEKQKELAEMFDQTLLEYKKLLR